MGEIQNISTRFRTWVAGFRWADLFFLLGGLLIGFGVALLAQLVFKTPDFLTFLGDDKPGQGLSILGAGVIALGTIAIAIWRNILLDRQNKTTLLSLEQQATRDRDARLASAFTSAIEQLGHPEAHVRAGACYALGKIATEDIQSYYRICIGLLCGFLRNQLPEIWEANKVPGSTAIEPFQDSDFHWPGVTPLPPDAMAALLSVSRANEETNGGFCTIDDWQLDQRLQLQYMDLRCLSAMQVPISLRRADLEGANLQNLTLKDSDFSQSMLFATRFTAKLLLGLDFRGATFDLTDFGNATIRGCDISSAQSNLSTKGMPSMVFGDNFSTQELFDAFYCDGQPDKSLTIEIDRTTHVLGDIWAR